MTNKLIDVLSEETHANSKFKADYITLVKSVLDDGEKLEKSQIMKLLKTAAIFSLHDDEKYKNHATKIIAFLLKEYRETEPVPFLAEIILTRLGDLPTISYMIKEKHGDDIFSYFGESNIDYGNPIHFPEVIMRKAYNQKKIGSEISSFTDFQTQIFHWLDDGNNLAFSAPTSAGKSHVIHNYIAKKALTAGPYSVAYIVPTKALIAEVQTSIHDHLQKLGISNDEYMVVTAINSKVVEQFGSVKKKIFVTTQERLQHILSHNTNLQIDLLIVDEAQKINDNARGVILEDVVEDITQNQHIQSVFIIPNVRNPEKIKKIFRIKSQFRHSTINRTPVCQNIFLIDFNKKDVFKTLMMNEFKDTNVKLKPILGKLKAEDRTQYGIKAWFATHVLKDEGHTLIYCNTRKECTNIAKRMTETLVKIDNNELGEVIEFLKDNVHQEYYLVEYLRYGIGYHYGNMQKFVRFIVKSLFDKKLIDYLCATSTLLEGVNLPANNVIIHKPKIGQKPMKRNSIKNLAGRAGRLGKDYYGNIYCIQLDEWSEGKDAFDGKLDEIKSATEKTFSDNIETLIEHLNSPIMLDDDMKNIETLSTSLIIKQLKSHDFESFFQKHSGVKNENKEKILNALKNIEQRISSLNKSIMLKNSGIDPRLQYDLYVYLKNEKIIPPPHPLSSHFYDEIESIFKILAKYLLKDTSNSYRYYVAIARLWLNQKSYKRIIENQIRYEIRESDSESRKEKINKTIDDVDKTLSQELKFNYSKALQCYCDIVEHIFQEKNEKISFCKNLAEFLEAGAYDSRVLLLMNIGISRNNSIALYKLLDKNTSTLLSALEWLRSHKYDVRKKINNDIAYKEIEYLLKD